MKLVEEIVVLIKLYALQLKKTGSELTYIIVVCKLVTKNVCDFAEWSNNNVNEIKRKNITMSDAGVKDYSQTVIYLQIF